MRRICSQLVLRRNGNQDRLVEAAADQLHLPARGQFAQMVEKLRMALLEPFEQRTGIVQAHANAGMPRQAIDKGQIGALVGLFEDGIEIADRLMGVDQENETELAQV